ncbi:MAG: hypothetical protein HKO66_12655 [Saprospiraceae bacterium]|nr:hypothetical protein [Bacteroidia bacterium]NNL93081.1 hypothetical protein [Saprospiraceae bacterium]
MRIQRIIYIILIFCCFRQGVAQDIFVNKFEISQDSFEVFKEQVSFPATKTVLVPRVKPKPKAKEELKESAPQSSGANGIVRYLIYALVILLSLFLITIIFSKIKKDKEINPIPTNLNEIEDISEINSEALYEKAIRESNYRLAIRMQFIKVLQILSENKIIFWQPNKTNRDYKNEIIDNNTRESFEYLTLIYDLAWYGNKSVTRDVFEVYNAKFLTFINNNNVRK